MNFDTTTSDNNKSPEEESDISAVLKHLIVDNDGSNTHGINDHSHKNSVIAASLLLPTPMNRPKSTSAMIAEKSNIWSENKLHEKTLQLDKQLYQSMVKMNVDRLEVVNDLARLKRSSSANSLSKLGDETNQTKRSHGNSRSHNNSPVIERKKTLSPLARGSQKLGNDSANRKSERASGIEIRITSDFSSDEEEKHDCVALRSISSPTIRRHCREERSQGDMVENVLRRYAKQTSVRSAKNSKRS